MRNVLFVSSAPYVYGGEINLLELLKTINTQAFNCFCIYNPSSRFEQYSLGENVKLIPVKFPVYSKKRVLQVLNLIARMFVFLKRQRIDLIYINISGDCKFFEVLSRYLAIPVIMHIHVDEPDESLRWIKADCADRVLFPSRSTMDTVLEHSPWLDREKCFYVHNAVDLKNYYPHLISHLKEDLSIESGCPTIGIVGQLKEIKGQHLFLEMARELISQNFRANFIVVGEDNTPTKSYEKLLREKVLQYGIGDRVHFLGFRNDIPEIMSLCDLLVVPSLHEPFGRVVIEALVCGTPVVASSVGGIVEIFDDGNGGLFFEKGSVEDLTAKVIYFFEHPSWWEYQKKTAVKVCRERFDQTVHTRKIENHIKAVLDTHKAV